jgi:hypothetical protein
MYKNLLVQNIERSGKKRERESYTCVCVCMYLMLCSVSCVFTINIQISRARIPGPSSECGLWCMLVPLSEALASVAGGFGMAAMA